LVGATIKSRLASKVSQLIISDKTNNSAHSMRVFGKKKHGTQSIAKSTELRMAEHLDVAVAGKKLGIFLLGCTILEDSLYLMSTMLKIFLICYSTVV
jgi:hypothetical protein